jgi:hypothetical protein
VSIVSAYELRSFTARFHRNTRVFIAEIQPVRCCGCRSLSAGFPALLWRWREREVDLQAN